MSQRDEILQIAESVTDLHGVDLYWVKYQNSRNAQRVQIMIDKPDGVTHTDCVKVSRALEVLFDEKINHPYELEVSSPGLERPLFVPEHYERVVGEEIQIKTYAPLDGSKVWSGKLGQILNGSITLDTAKGPKVIRIEEIASAHVLPQFDYS